MREGWSLKDAGYVLGISSHKVTQAIGPSFRKIARLMLADPYLTHIELMAAMKTIHEEMVQVEIARREAMNEGRLDRAVLHPDRPTHLTHPVMTST